MHDLSVPLSFEVICTLGKVRLFKLVAMTLQRRLSLPLLTSLYQRHAMCYCHAADKHMLIAILF